MNVFVPVAAEAASFSSFSPLLWVGVLGFLSGAFGLGGFWGNFSARMMFLGYLVLFLGWTALLFGIGFWQQSCPIHGMGQVFVFLSWSLLLFYLVSGATYRLSFLGTLTGALVFVFAASGFFAGIEPEAPRGMLRGDLHVGFALLSYAGFSLSALASVAFFIQDRHLKRRQLGGAYHKLPKLNLLAKVAPRLNVLGLVLLTASMAIVLAEFRSPTDFKLVMAGVTWAGYALLALVNWRRGMPGRWFALMNLTLFVVSLTVLFASK